MGLAVTLKQVGDYGSDPGPVARVWTKGRANLERDKAGDWKGHDVYAEMIRNHNSLH